jgi:hypothetical protein
MYIKGINSGFLYKGLDMHAGVMRHAGIKNMGTDSRAIMRWIPALCFDQYNAVV